MNPDTGRIYEGAQAIREAELRGERLIPATIIRHPGEKKPLYASTVQWKRKRGKAPKRVTPPVEVR